MSANSNAFAPPARLGSGIPAATAGTATMTAAAKVSPQQPPQKVDTVPAKTTGQGEEQKTEEAIATEMATAVVAQNEEVAATNG